MRLNEWVKNHVNTTVPFFGDNDLAVEVLPLMQARRVNCAPLLRDGKIAAMVTIQDLLPLRESKKRLKELKLEKTESIGLHEHLFDIFSRTSSIHTTLVPVSEEDGRYVGVIEKEALFKQISDIFHLGDEGVTLELDVPSVDLKLSEVIATLEKNDATVLSFGSYSAAPEGESMVLTFRLQTYDLFRLARNLGKIGYHIRYTSPFFREKDDEMREKALEFIRFMDM
jgi:acetoin utilization protein AcuB